MTTPTRPPRIGPGPEDMRLPLPLPRLPLARTRTTGRTFASDNAAWSVSTAKGAPPTLQPYQSTLSVRTDDGFVGERTVQDSAGTR